MSYFKVDPKLIQFLEKMHKKKPAKKKRTVRSKVSKRTHRKPAAKKKKPAAKKRTKTTKKRSRR